MSRRIVRLLAASGLLCASLLCLASSRAQAGEAKPLDPELFKKIRSVKTGEMSGELNTISGLAIASFGNPDLRKALEAQFIDILRAPDATMEAKQFVCRQLFTMGTAASVPALAPLLTDEKLSHMARYALERMQCPEAGKALRDALGTAKGKLLIGVVNSVGQRRDAEAVPTLVGLLKQTDAELSEAAARALGKTGGDASAAALAAARAGAAGRVRQATDDGWLLCADQFLASGSKDKAKAIYDALYAPAEAKNLRAAALRGLVAIGGDDAIALIMKSLTSGDPALQGVAVSYIRDVPGSEATKAFAAELAKLPPPAQVLVIGAFASRGDAAALPAVTAVAGSQDPQVRVAALTALGTMGGAASVPLLVKATASDQKPEADAARASLVILGGEGVDAAILAELKKADPNGRVELIKTLAARRAQGAVPELLKIAEDPDEAVRREAFTAIGKLADAKTFPALVALVVKARSDDSLKAAERAVLTVARDITDDEARTAALVGALPGATGAGKTALLSILARFGGEKALGAVRAALDDKDPQVHDAALRALADWPDATPADDLLKIVRTTDNQVHRVLALRGYVRLLALPSERPIADVLTRYDETMKLATRVEDKKLVLASMAELRHPDVVRALQPYAADPALKAEAEAAIKKVQEAMKAPAKLTASANADKAANATDGKPDTRWDTGAAQQGGEWFMIELPVEQTLTKLTLDTRGSGGDYPRGYEVYISRDGKSWGPPVVKGEGKGAVTEIALKPTFGRFVKIVQTGKSDGLFWSIHELKLETKPTE